MDAGTSHACPACRYVGYIPVKEHGIEGKVAFRADPPPPPALLPCMPADVRPQRHRVTQVPADLPSRLRSGMIDRV